MPRWYSVFGGKLNFYPVPDAVYNYTMQYWRGIGTMPSADSDVYLMDDDDTPILTLGALTRLGLRENNMWKYNIAQDKFVQALAQMLRNAKVEQSQTIRRAPMNYQYSGVYDDDQQR